MKATYLLTLAASLFSGLAAPSRLCAQNPPEHVISMDVKRVVLYATVREGKAKFAGDLTKENFVVLEDGKPQTVDSFSRDDVPVAIGLLIDNSQSMMNKRDQVIAAAKAFVRASKPKDEIFVLHFNEKLTYGLPPDVPFSGDVKVLDKALDNANLDGLTRLYDAIDEGLKHLQNSKLTKRALIVVSDGGDNLSTHKAAEVVRDADLSGALFYGIGIYDEHDGDANPGVLRRLAENTGGEAYFPDGVAAVKTLCENIARDLRTQYMLSYAPPDDDGKKDYRKIQVRVKDPKGRKLIVRTRTGYTVSRSNAKGAAKP